MSPLSDAFVFVDLVYPDPVDLGPLVSWERTVLRFAEQPQRVLARCERRYVPPVLQHPNEQVRELAKRFSSESAEQRALVVCLGAVLQQALVVVVKQVESEKAFELKPLVWQGKALLVCHPLSLVRTGLFAPSVGQLPSASLSIRLSGGTLYVPEQQQVRIIADHQRASVAELEGLTKLLIEEHEAAGNKITYADFLSRIERETEATRRQIQRSWATVPANLKYMNRPRGR